MNMIKKYFLIEVLIFVGVLFMVGCGTKEEKETFSKVDYLVLVNKYSQLPDDWEDKVNLINAKNVWDEDIKIEKETYENYKKLKNELKNDGVVIELDSIYRSVKAQQDLWDSWSKDPEKGIDYVRKYVAVPGYSEHHTGLAIDICLNKDGNLVYDNDEMIADRETFAKIHAKLADYGFILRYLENRDDITGYAYEPWHLRYVGSVEIAKEIMEKDITFEEYLASIKNVKENKAAAKYQIEKALQEKLKLTYGDKVLNSRFNVTKIYSSNEEKDNPELKSLALGKNEVAFEVTYQIQPRDIDVVNELTIPDGEYNDVLEWIVNIRRVGVLKYDDKTNTYSITNFGTEF